MSLASHRSSHRNRLAPTGGFTTACAAVIELRNGSAKSGVLFDASNSATLGTGTIFAGNILATQSFTLGAVASILCGRAIALGGAVTLDTNIVSNDCNTGGHGNAGCTDFGSGGLAGNVTSPARIPVPEPASLALLGIGLLGAATHRITAQDPARHTLR